MSYARVHSAQVSGLDAHIVDIEIDLLRGLHSFSIVGLPDKAVEEASDRVSAALKNSGFESPKKKNHKIVVSLAPAGIRKEGPVFDLGIAIAYLKANEELVFDESGKIFIGELSLEGKVRGVRGVLPLVIEARKRGFTEVYLPKENVEEARLVEGVHVYSVETLVSVVKHLTGEERLKDRAGKKNKVKSTSEVDADFAYVKGQEGAKRALEIAASGRHNIALFGPPGTGKTMLARALQTILPDLSFEEMLEVTSIHSIAGLLEGSMLERPPFRSPHHTSSYVSVIGGGTYPKPGEVTLAHRGILFLDEFAEFEKRVIETLRQPLEDRVVSISRSKGSATFPANFMLVAAMNPYPAGYEEGSRQYLPHEIERYRRKISGPIIDRIDMWIEVGKVDYDKLRSKTKSEESSRDVKRRVDAARKIQEKRFKKKGITTNSEMKPQDLETHAELPDDAESLLKESAEKLGLSARSYHRVIKLARTIADLEGSDSIESSHILEAIQYRPKAF